jgi:benzoate/toluate 1,2-dioxygenase reductase component
MTYRIALNFEDGATRIIDCNRGETVLDAAYRQKVNLPMDCSDGVCGTCKCRCEEGRYDLGDDYIADALSAEEADEGLVLTCQMVPASDCIIAVPVPSRSCKLTATAHGATIAAVECVSDSTILLRVTLDHPETLDFLPGQYVNLQIPGTRDMRAYSFSSKPGATTAQFLIRNVPGGRMSRWLTEQARPGDRLSMMGPQGSFFLRDVVRPVLMLAGGTGLAPILSMLEVLADRGCGWPIHLIYGVTHDRDLVEIDRLNGLAARLADFSWKACVSSAAASYPCKGFVTDHLNDVPFDIGGCDVYLCGPPVMVEVLRTAFRDRGVTPVHFRYEKFAASEAVPA